MFSYWSVHTQLFPYLPLQIITFSNAHLGSSRTIPIHDFITPDVLWCCEIKFSPPPFPLVLCSVMKDICLYRHCCINIPNSLFFLLARIIAAVLRKFADLPIAQMSQSSVVLLPCTGWRCLVCLTSSWQFWTFLCIPALRAFSQLSNISSQFI